MCGYCLEGGFTLNFIERERTSEKLEFEGRWAPFCIQESTDFPKIIDRINVSDNFPESIDVSFCRLWETLLYRKHGDTYNFLVSKYGPTTINKFLSELKGKCGDEEWESLGDSEIYTNSDCWDQFIERTSQSVDNHESALRSYYDFWILGEDKEISDPMRQLKETGIMDPIKNTTPNDRERFYSLFPFLYFSLLILEKHKRDSEVFSLIALKCPKNVPDFPGYDLWLQRKAFVACVRDHGLPFVLDNYDEIRLELIYYGLLKDVFCTADLGVLRDHLLGQDHGVVGFDSDSVIELIDNLA